MVERPFYCRDRFVANDFIQMRKVAEHVVEKVCGSGSESGSVAGGPAATTTDRAAEENHDSGSLAEDKVELFCNDVVSTSTNRTYRLTISRKRCVWECKKGL